MSIRKYIACLMTITISILLISSLAYCQEGIKQEIYQFQGFSGIFVQDLSSCEVLLSYNQDKLFTPASLVKIFTLLAGLEIFEQEYRYPTVFYFSSSIPGEIEGDLFIKGSGDPTQSPEVIREIANKLLKKYSIHQISGDIVLDDSFFSPEEFLGRGWMWDDENPLISALTVKGGNVQKKQISYYKTMPLSWGNIFCQELNKQGIKFNGDLRIKEVEENLKVKAIFYSDTLEEILAHMMKMSDNQSAEAIFRTLPMIQNPEKPYTISQSIASMSEIIFEKLGIQWGEDYVLVDGCGLSEYNLLTPVQVANAITYLYQKYGSEISKYFANTREKGTIRERFPFQIWAKTGSLPSASGLAGILHTRNNRDIVFCLMENNFSGEHNDPKKYEDSIIEYIYENY